MASASLVFELIGRDKSASTTMDKVGKSATSAGDKMRKVSSVAGKVLAGGLLAGGAAAVKLTQAAADDEQAQAKLAQQLINSAGASRTQIAATEAWISAQGKALGIADDDLRPALAKLATVTKDVGESQRLAALAMDVSTGSGKNLNTVVEAFQKAANGSVGGLSRLGVATKNAAGETLSFEQIQKNLAKTYAGQASKAADTAAGKQKRLQVALGELGEEAGGKLLPVMLKLAGAGLKMVDWVGKNQRLVLTLGAAIVGVTATVWAVGAAMKAWAAIQAVWTVATKAGTAAQWLMNAAMTANPIGLVIVAIAGLVAGLVIAYKKSETFRKVVNAAWGAVKTAAVKSFTFLKGFLVKTWNAISANTRAAWGMIRKFIVDPISKAVEWVKSRVAIAKLLITAGWNIIKAKTQQVWAAVVGLVRQHVDRMVNIVRTIKGKVTGLFSGAKKWLLDAGKAVVQGLLDGLAWGKDKVEDAARSLADKIPGPVRKVLGISSPSKVMRKVGRQTGEGLEKGLKDKEDRISKAGARLVAGLVKGIRKERVPLAKALDEVTGYFEKQRDRWRGLLSARRDFASGFQSMTSSVFAADLGGDSGRAPTVDSMLQYQLAELRKAQQVRSSVSRLTKLGLSKSLIRQMQASGESGMTQINALASTASRQQIAKLNQLDKATAANLQQAGMTAGTAIYGDAIADARRRGELAAAIGREMAKALRQERKQPIVVKLEGRDLVYAIRKEKRRQGGKKLGLD